MGNYVRDNMAIAPFATLTVSDPDMHVLTVIVTITNGIHRGDFTVGSRTGWVRTIKGSDIVYSRTFPTAVNIGSIAQAAVRGLKFQPRKNAITPGLTETTTFVVSLNDGIAAVVSDGTTSVVSRSVNDRPTGQARTYQVRVNAVLRVSAAAGLLRGAHDRDVGQHLRARLFRGPDVGTLALNPDGSFRFVPPTGFLGRVTFTFRVFDGQSYSQPITIAINVVMPADPRARLGLRLAFPEVLVT
ncbi:MAG: hypothetical protein FJ271_23810 [Planctomycetes bacterium]|nr:hypothetical protein [Planctomycetota bacterium]